MRRSLAFVFVCFLFSLDVLGAAALRFSKEGPHNFGIVMHNEAHTIYRSAGLGRSGLKDVFAYLKKRNLPLPKTVIHMNIDGYRVTFVHGLFAVEEYEDSKKYGYAFYHSFDPNFSTYLSGSNPYEAHKNKNQEKFLGDAAKTYFGFNPTRPIVGGMDSFYGILDLILDAKEPVLFHCTAGQHRTGMIAMAIRYLQGGAWREGAYEGPSRSTKLNAAQHEYYLHNKRFFKRENIDFIEQWARDPMFAEYEANYQARLNLPSLLLRQ